MATLCGFGQIPDIAVKSLCCYSRVVLDRDCNLSVANASIDTMLSVDIGANVNMMAATINFKNSSIDFTGASLTGFTGNIEGNLTLTNLVILGNITSDAMIANTVCASVIKGNLRGNVVGDLCGNAVVHKITAKGGASNDITIIGNLNGSLVGNLFGTSIGTHCGPVQTNSISEKTSGSGISVTGNLNGFHTGVFCGDIQTRIITEKITGNGITFIGNVFINKLTVDIFTGNLTGLFCGNVRTNSIEPKANAEIVIGGTVLIPLAATIGTATITTLSVDSLAPLLSSNVFVFGGMIITGPVTAPSFCGNLVTANVIQEKIANGGIQIVGNLTSDQNLTVNAICVGDLTVKGNLAPNVATLVVNEFTGNLTGNVCGSLFTSLIREKVDMNGIQVIGNVDFGNAIAVMTSVLTPKIISMTALTVISADETMIVSGDALTVTSGGTTTITSAGTTTINSELGVTVNGPVTMNDGATVCGANLIVANIAAKNINGNIDVFGNLILHSALIGDVVAPRVEADKMLLKGAELQHLLYIGPNEELITDNGGTAATNFTYDDSTKTLNIPTTGSITIGGSSIASGAPFTSTEILFGDGTTVPASASDFAYTTGTNTLSISGSGIINLTGVSSLLSVASLTPNGVIYTGLSDELLTDTGMTYDDTANELTVTGTIALTGLTAASVLFLDGSDKMTEKTTSTGFTFTTGTDLLNVPTGGGFSVGSTQVVGPQGSAVSNAAAATAATLTAGIGIADQILQTITASGDDTKINNNFEDCVDEINKLIADVADVRAQLNALLAELRASSGHGIIA